ncbi:MAG TPA: prolyl oligopeptidase family serine peptidase [Steroidobacteraceae bacterium]|nr:prolyl oligopeptidase family serine peptidase [Steroidobacteraceae bacterium]
MRQPWTRGGTDSIRQWDISDAHHCSMFVDCLDAMEGEANADIGTAVKWQPLKTYSDFVGFDAASGPPGRVVFARTRITRDKAGKVTLSVGSVDGIRVWINGKPVMNRDGNRAWTPDEDQFEVDLVAGDNRVLVKGQAPGGFSLRVLEAGALPPRLAEIGPSIIEQQPELFTVRTDVSPARAKAEPVKVEVLKPGGEVLFTKSAPRGELVLVDAKGWRDGPYEVRVSTRTPQGKIYLAHLPWFKGDSLAKARELAAEAAKADASKPEGFTLRMLAEMVGDRLGVKLADAKGNPWPRIHSPLMEFEELMLERAGQVGRVRADGFVRLAWIDDTDGSPQYARAYLPSRYDAVKKWPLVVQLHGFNPPNPVYWRWWSADSRHALNTENADQGVIYMEPHGRGNVQYLSFADSDVLRAIAEARRTFNVDEDRIYLNGESMGGWGTWHVATRHPELFAAIAPVHGGADYHAQLPEEELARLTPLDRFLHEKQSSWSMAESLINTPMLVQHGDLDQSVNVEWSRWGVKLLQRWGYDVRYHEYPGRAHEALTTNNGFMNVDWFLEHTRDPNPRKVRLRSAELRNASAWWARVRQSANPLDFMRVDAEVVDSNLIRLDTDNVLDIELAPSAALIDASKPVTVVWNGVAQDVRAKEGVLGLTAASYKPASLHKTPVLPGSSNDFLMTPFAVVIGTSSKDPDMVKMCRTKAQDFIDAWKDWQKVAPRVFLDSEIGDAEVARYSLLLIGGPEANRVAAKLAAKLPLTLSADSIRIDGHEFRARNAAVQMIYPNPRNTERYVWIFAGTSANGMFFAEPNPQRIYDWDYVILDGRIPAYKQAATAEQTRVASGTFDYNWRYSGSSSVAGDADIRAHGRQLRRPDGNLQLDARTIDGYLGHYQIENGPVVEMYRQDAKLRVRGGGPDSEMLPESETIFFAKAVNVRVFFERDAAGKVTGFTTYGDGEYTARKLD